ncbi:MAG: DUF814 domain-containing protein [Sandaracinaceae bacterium]|nr:DUF814 domain-containing protein [Sandaracinaceae bacterium]
MTSIAELEGAQLQRVDGPHPSLFTVSLHRPGLTGALVLSLVEPAEWGWVSQRPKGDPASAFVGQLRKHLANGRVVDARAHGEGAVLEVVRGDHRARLHLTRRPANLVLEVDDRVLGAADPGALRRAGIALGEPWPIVAPSAPELPATFEALAERGPHVVERTLRSSADDRRGPLMKALRRHAVKLRRRLVAIDTDLDRLDEVPTLRGHADLLLASLRSIPSGATEATLTDWVSQEPIVIPIRPGKTPLEEAEALYRRARKLERGAQIAMDRHALTEEELARIAALLADAATAGEAELEAIERAAKKLGVRRDHTGPRAKEASRVPHRTFLGAGGRPILVGRNARDNDALTGSARSWDRWLHARGVRGSHVVIPLDKREECPDPLLLDAAHLAAHFSAARGEPIVDVQHCPRRNVRKPKGMAPGAVLVDREAVVAVRFEPDRLARLLATASE